jgi:hypothetical protein
MKRAAVNLPLSFSSLMRLNQAPLFLLIALDVVVETENVSKQPGIHRQPDGGTRPRLPSNTGSATAILFCTGVRCICLLNIGIIADIVLNTAKQRANAPVPSVS